MKTILLILAAVLALLIVLLLIAVIHTLLIPSRKSSYTAPKETEKATETTADDSSKGPGMQETISNSGNTSGENTEKADLIGPGV